MPPSAPAGSHGNETAPGKPNLDAPLSKNEPTSGPAGSSYETYAAKQQGQPAPQLPTPASPPQQPQGQQNPPQPLGQHAPGTPDQRLQAILDSGFQSRAAAEKGRDAHDIADTAKDLGSKALHGLKTLSTGQIALGVGVLAAGIAFFLTKGKKKYPKVRDQRGGRHRDDHLGHQPRAPRGNDQGRGQRPWGTTRYAGDAGSYGRGRVQGGSGYDERRSRGGRRDQGTGSRYDVRAGGRQNPSNRDQLGSAF